VSFGEDLRFRVPRGARLSLADLAAVKGTTVPELLRQMVRRELDRAAADGVNVEPLDWAPHGQHLPEGSTRRTLPPDIAAGIRAGLHRSGLSLRQAADILDIDNSYLCRLAQGTRFPSHSVAARLVNQLPIDDETADALLDLTADKHSSLPRLRRDRMTQPAKEMKQ